MMDYADNIPHVYEASISEGHESLISDCLSTYEAVNQS